MLDTGLRSRVLSGSPHSADIVPSPVARGTHDVHRTKGAAQPHRQTIPRRSIEERKPVERQHRRSSANIERPAIVSTSKLQPPSIIKRESTKHSHKVSRSLSFTHFCRSSLRRATTLFHFCATCGRSTGVRLTACKQCEKAHFCSKACRTTGWEAFHGAECQPVDRSRKMSNAFPRHSSAFVRLQTMRPESH